MEEEKDTSWEERFDEEFDCVMWWGCYNKDGSQKHGYETDCGDELKSFIRQERKALLREVLDECENMRKKEHTCESREGMECEYSQALSEVQELIKKKI